MIDRRVSRCMVLMMFFCAVSASAADDAPEPVAAPSPANVLLFKSGQAYLQRKISLDRSAETVRVLLPPSMHGSVWLDAEPGRVKRAISRFEPHGTERNVIDLPDLLHRAVGEKVRLELSGDEASMLDGRVLRLLESDAAEPPSMPRRSGGPTPRRASHVAVEVGSAVRVLPIGRIASLTLEPGVAGDWTFEERSLQQVLEIELEGKGGAGTADLHNMAGGLAWAPSYVLELGEDGESRLRGKAVVVNDLEDLEGTRVRLVIGFPNIEFGGVDSALMPSVTLERLASMLGGSNYQSRRGRPPVMMQQMRAPEMAAESGAAGEMVEMPGDTSEDLFVYDIGELDLARGERVYVPLSDQRVGHAHRFDWNLPDTVQNERFQVQQQQQADPPPVWHVLKLSNGGRAPWTTAPILVLGDQGPIAQSTLRYTPPEGDTRVRLTQALDIVGRADEVRADEAHSDRQTVMLFGNRYEQVEVLGRLELHNRSRRRVPMHVAKALSGDVLTAEGSPEIEARAAGLGQVNASRTLTWEFELDAGAEWSAEYRYSVLIRR